MRTKIILSFIIISFILIFVKCSSQITDSEDIVFPETEVSYISSVEPFLKITCAYAGCHNSTSRARGLVLDNYFDLTNSMSGGFIIGKNPDQSYLIQVLDGTYVGCEIYWRFKINDNHKAGMRKWIEEGALNN